MEDGACQTYLWLYYSMLRYLSSWIKTWFSNLSVQGKGTNVTGAAQGSTQNVRRQPVYSQVSKAAQPRVRGPSRARSRKGIPLESIVSVVAFCLPPDRMYPGPRGQPGTWSVVLTEEVAVTLMHTWRSERINEWMDERMIRSRPMPRSKAPSGSSPSSPRGRRWNAGERSGPRAPNSAYGGREEPASSGRKSHLRLRPKPRARKRGHRASRRSLPPPSPSNGWKRCWQPRQRERRTEGLSPEFRRQRDGKSGVSVCDPAL